MSNKITKIQIETPKETKLPNGVYIGEWGGNTIKLRYQKKNYLLTTEEGVRGMGFKVVVRIKDNDWTFEQTNHLMND